MADRVVKNCEIVGQKLVQKKNGDLAVVLSVRFPLLKESTDTVPSEVEVWLSFGGGNQLEISYKILKTLGFDDVDFTKLDSESDQFHSLLGKKVDLKNREGSNYWNIMQPFPKVDMKAAKQFVKQNKEQLESAKNPDLSQVPY